MVAQLFGNNPSTGNENVVKAIEILSAHLNENEFESLVCEILQCVRKDGIELVPAIIDMEFAGDFDSLYQVLWFVLEVNFASFFSMLGIGSQSQDPQANQVATKKTFTRN